MRNIQPYTALTIVTSYVLHSAVHILYWCVTFYLITELFDFVILITLLIFSIIHMLVLFNTFSTYLKMSIVKSTRVLNTILNERSFKNMMLKNLSIINFVFISVIIVKFTYKFISNL
ncbi:MAG: hypothetical protein RLZZ546_1525 [Bacteroidota bacterium]